MLKKNTYDKKSVGSKNVLEGIAYCTFKKTVT